MFQFVQSDQIQRSCSNQDDADMERQMEIRPKLRESCRLVENLEWIHDVHEQGKMSHCTSRMYNRQTKVITQCLVKATYIFGKVVKVQPP